VKPAFYADPKVIAHPTLRGWWNVLHPPYTLWHLSYVVIGACLATHVDVPRLVATLLAFFLAVGVGAHALDELKGHPLRTGLPDWALVAAAVAGIGGAVILGIAGVSRVGGGLIAFIVVGVALAVGYNLELFGGLFHTDYVFAASWGSFPLLTAYYAQQEGLSLAAAIAALFAFFLSLAQRRLSTPARMLRRKTTAVTGTLTRADGTEDPLDVHTLLAPLEMALRALVWCVIALAIALAVLRLG
jgi:hypothetical protein